MASSGCSRVAAHVQRRQVAGVRVAQRLAREDRRGRRSRRRRAEACRAAWSSPARAPCAGHRESQLRASMKKRTIALSAAVSTPLPATSPTSTATLSPPPTGQAPYTSPPVGLVRARARRAGRSRSRAAAAATPARSRASARARCGARAGSRSRWRSPRRTSAPASRAARGRPRRSGPGSSCPTVSTPYRRGPSSIGACMTEPSGAASGPLRSTGARVRTTWPNALLSSDASWPAISSGQCTVAAVRVSRRARAEPREQRAGRAADRRGVLGHAHVHLGGVERAGDLLGGPLQPQLVAGAAALGLEQAGPLERDRGEVGERLDGRHLVLAERTAPVDARPPPARPAGCRTRPAPGRRSATPPGASSTRAVPPLRRARRRSRRPARGPPATRRRAAAAACRVRASCGHAGRERRAQVVVGEPADRVAASRPRPVTNATRGHGQHGAHVLSESRERALSPRRGSRRRRGDRGKRAWLGHRRGPRPASTDMSARAVSPPAPRSGGACRG